MNNEISWGQQGWVCPKCGSVWAPHVDGCHKCNSGYDNSLQGIGQGDIDAVPLPYKPNTTAPVGKWWEDYGLNISESNASIQDLVKGENIIPSPVYYRGKPAIITNASEMADWFDGAEVVNVDTINEYFLSKNA